MSFELSMFFRTDPPPQSAIMIRGGIRMSANGNRINQFNNEESIQFTHDWNPQYIGEHLRSDLVSLYKVLEAVDVGESGLYDAQTVDLTENWGYFVVEKISASHLRVAYRIGNPERLGWDHLPLKQSSVGYLVSIPEFREEVVAAGDEFLLHCQDCGVENERLTEDFADYHSEFEV
jgi:hypothetical protein